MHKGVLRKWNDVKGFGFIESETEGQDIFFHISSLQGTERRPVVGDVLYFQITQDLKGRKNAAHVSIEGVKSVFREIERVDGEAGFQKRAVKKVRTPSNTAKTAAMLRFFFRRAKGLLLALAIIIVANAYLRNRSFDEMRRLLPVETQDVEKAESASSSPDAAAAFQCAGKTRCSQMTSCEEATFYLQHCPGTLADGDGDGKPCENQWCGH